MPAVTIRNLPEATHNALKIRARSNKRSTEAEIRAILEDVTKKPEKGLGTALYELGQRFGGIELDTRLPGDNVEFEDFK